MARPAEAPPPSIMIASWLLLLTFLAVGSLGAQEAVVAYIDGQAETLQGTAWGALAIGDAVGLDAAVRLGRASFLELSASGTTIALSQPGTYVVGNLLAASAKLRAGGIGSTLSTALSYLIKGSGRTQSSIMGARGANEGKSDDSAWVTSVGRLYRDEGKDDIASGQYPKAINRLQQALDEASDDETPEIKYLLASAYNLNGDTRNSLKEASEITPTGGESWSSDFVLLKAKLLIDTNAFEQAVQLLTRDGASLAHDAQRAQLYFFVLALGYRGIGDSANEQAALAKAIVIAPASDVGNAGAALAKNL